MKRALTSLAAVGAVLSTSGVAVAATVSVDTTADDVAAMCAPGTGCSLRGAVSVANAAPGTTIDLPAGTYSLTQGPLTITAPQTVIAGDGVASTTVTGASPGRGTPAISIRAGNVALADLTVAAGSGSDVSFDPTGSSANELDLLGVTIRDGRTRDNGGGISMPFGGRLAIIDSTIVDNGASGERGGGLYASGGQVLIDGSVFNGNGTSANNALGGAIFVSQTTLTVRNSTVYGNSVASGGFGGDLAFVNDSHVNLINATIARGQYGGTSDVYGSDTSTISAVNTIIGEPRGGGQACFLPGPVMVDDHSMSSDATCGLSAAHGSIINADPLFLALGDYGGPTQSVAYTEASPAVDAGNSDPSVCPNIDQRYAPRPYGAGCDIGALESPYSRASGGTAGGSAGGGGSSTKTPDATSATPPGADPSPTPASPATTTAPTMPTPATTAAKPTPSLRLARTGQLIVKTNLPARPADRVTLTWTVTKGGRTYHGTAHASSTGTELVTTIVLPRKLRGARLISVQATYRTSTGRTQTTVLRPAR
jgi:hypothetical protein